VKGKNHRRNPRSQSISMPAFRALLLVLYRAGVRLGEALGLRVADEKAFAVSGNVSSVWLLMDGAVFLPFSRVTAPPCRDE
jgi:hypothetical protein